MSKPSPLSPYERKVADWCARNRGILTRIAEKANPKVTPQYVHMVVRGKKKSKDGRIESMLRRAGAPIL
jgi:hypothetical protein